jgi:hypothetical protein
LERDGPHVRIATFEITTMKAKLLILLAATMALASCSSTDKALPVVLRDGEDLESRHSKGSWLPHNS